MKGRPGSQVARQLMPRRPSQEERKHEKVIAYTQKTLNRLMVTLLEFIKDQDVNAPEVKAKIEWLNEKWLKHCRNTPEIHFDIAKDTFMGHAQKALDDMPAVMKIPLAPDPPSGVPSSEI